MMYLCRAEERMYDGFMPITSKTLMGHRAPPEFAEEKERTRDLSNLFRQSQAFQFKSALGDKQISTTDAMLTSNSV